MGDGIFDSIVRGISAVAPTVANLIVPGSGPLLGGLMRAVTGDGPGADIEAVAAKIQADPAKMIELQKLAVEREVGLAQVEAAKLETVNAQMGRESQSEHWPQYSWRPFNGFMFPITMFANMVVLPACGITPPVIPVTLIATWAAILGVGVLGRNKEKAAKAAGNGQPLPGILEGVINAIKR